MNKKVLMVATVPSMIGQFNRSNISILRDLGYKVDVAADFSDTSVWDKNKTDTFLTEMKNIDVDSIQISFSRNPLRIKKHISSYKEVLSLLKNNDYAFIHTHTPIASSIVRLAARKTNTKVIYTAHGFHFYKGASLKNWIVFFPIEWVCSFFTDALITITKEDYRFASNHMHAKNNYYVPGVGVDISKFSNNNDSAHKILLKQYGIKDSDTVVTSVGELNRNKNHEVVIRAISNLNNDNIHYCIVGQGEQIDSLKSLISSLELENNIHLLGYRNDVNVILGETDIYALPSIREGLNVSLMEAMAAGLPCICGDIRGNRDLITEGMGGYLVNSNDAEEWSRSITLLLDREKREKMGAFNLEQVSDFSKELVDEKMRRIYTEWRNN